MFSNDNKALTQYSDSEKHEKKSDIIIILGYFIGITNEIRMGQHSVTVTWEFPDDGWDTTTECNKSQHK